MISTLKAAIVLAGLGVHAQAVSESYLSRMASSWIIHDNNKTVADRSYGRACLDNGYEAAIELTGNDTLLAWYRNRIDTLVVANGTIPGFNESHFSLDDYRLGHNFLYWFERTGEEKFRTAADTVRAMLDRHPRTPTGGFWHRSPTYKDQMWLDGIYMADTFYGRWTALFEPDNQTAWDDIALQYDKIEITRDHETNLLVHGFDESKKAVWADPVTGNAPLVWNRAVGWYFMALVEILHVFPREHEAYDRLMRYYVSLADGLLRSQDPDTHGWWLIMTEPYREGNYFEASSAAMFAYGWLAGLRLGWLDEETYLEPASRAYKHIIDDFVTHKCDGNIRFDGTVRVGSLGSNATFEYYVGIPVVPNDTRGVGPFMLAAYEWELRQAKTT